MKRNLCIQTLILNVEINLHFRIYSTEVIRQRVYLRMGASKFEAEKEKLTLSGCENLVKWLRGASETAKPCFFSDE